MHFSTGKNHRVDFQGTVSMIFTDIDGTFVDDHKNITPGIQAAVGETVAQNIPLAFATGRMYASIIPWIRQLNLTAPQIVNNGAEIIRPADGSHLLHLTFSRDTLAWLVRESQASGFVPMVFTTRRLMATTHSDCDWMLARNNEIVEIVSQQDILKADSEKVVLLAQGERLEALDRLEQRFNTMEKPQGVSFKAVISETGILNIVPGNVTKLQAIQFLCRTLNCPIQQVMAIGDGDNDADMLAGVGCGVAMGNATPLARDAANAIVDDNLHDGAAQALRFACQHHA